MVFENPIQPDHNRGATLKVRGQLVTHSGDGGRGVEGWSENTFFSVALYNFHKSGWVEPPPPPPRHSSSSSHSPSAGPVEVTVQFETRGNGQNEIVSLMDRSDGSSFKSAKKNVSS